MARTEEVADGGGGQFGIQLQQKGKRKWVTLASFQSNFSLLLLLLLLQLLQQLALLFDYYYY